MTRTAGLALPLLRAAGVAALLVVAPSPAPSIAWAADYRLVEKQESLYNDIFVHDDGGYKVMTFGHNRRHYTESRYNPRDELELPVPYTRLMTVGLAYLPRPPASMMMIGLGGGRTSWYLHRMVPGLDITAVELDPGVVELALRHFGIREEPGYHIVTGDGRMALMKSNQRHDMILLDAYRGPFVPFHLLTQEFYRLVGQRLAPGGVVVQNIEPSTMLFDSAIATMKSVFETVEIFPANGNVVAVAHDGPAPAMADLHARAVAAQESLGFRYSLPDLVALRRSFTPRESIKPLTDDFAPVNALNAIESHNRKWDD